MPGSMALSISGVPSTWCIVNGKLIISRKLATKLKSTACAPLPENEKTVSADLLTIQVENSAYIPCPIPDRIDTNSPYSLLTNAAQPPKTDAANSGANIWYLVYRGTNWAGHGENHSSNNS